MKPKAQIVTVIGLLVAAAAASIPIAHASSFQDIMNGYFARNSNNAYTGQAVQNANQPAIMNNLDTERNNLRQAIRSAEQSNSISAAQAADLSAELNTIDAREANDAATNGFAYAETQSLVNAMSAVNTRLQQYISSSANNYAVNSGSNNAYYRQGNYGSSDIRNRISSLTNRINHELRDGDISNQEASNMLYRLNAIKQDMPFGYRRRDGGMTDAQIQGRLASVEARLAYDLQNRNQFNTTVGDGDQHHHHHDYQQSQNRNDNQNRYDNQNRNDNQNHYDN